MHYNKGHQLTVGELKALIQLIPDETKMFVGIGDNIEPLRYLCEHNRGLMFHTNVYGMDAISNNVNTILQLSYGSKG